mmetsp:Transcript_72264/g.200465  ORF Transcript_72264/g.200465 Transcript_72264/m.200465 type:complete len:108 (-) Transcript_72264:876-1199(-)
MRSEWHRPRWCGRRRNPGQDATTVAVVHRSSTGRCVFSEVRFVSSASRWHGDAAAGLPIFGIGLVGTTGVQPCLTVVPLWAAPWRYSFHTADSAAEFSEQRRECGKV